MSDAYEPFAVRKPRRRKKAGPAAIAEGAEMADEAPANGVVGAELQQFVERIERLEEEKTSIGDDIKVVYAELKASGYDTKVVRRVIALRKKDAAEHAEEEALLELYMNALGMLADTPLGETALDRARSPR